MLGLAELCQVLEGVPDLPRADQEVHHRLLVVVILTEAEININHINVLTILSILLYQLFSMKNIYLHDNIFRSSFEVLVPFCLSLFLYFLHTGHFPI